MTRPSLPLGNKGVSEWGGSELVGYTSKNLKYLFDESARESRAAASSQQPLPPGYHQPKVKTSLNSNVYVKKSRRNLKEQI